MEIPQNVIPFEFGALRGARLRPADPPALRPALAPRGDARAVTSVAGGLANTPLELREVTPAALRTLRLLGVTHVLRAKSLRATPPDRRASCPIRRSPRPGCELVYDGPDARVYASRARCRARSWSARSGWSTVATPRATTVDQPGLRRAPGGGDREAAARACPTTRGAPRAAGSARIVSYEPERVVVRARSAGPGLLVLGDNWFPGWKAEGGRHATCRSSGSTTCSAACASAPGAHRVEFRYEPRELADRLDRRACCRSRGAGGGRASSAGGAPERRLRRRAPRPPPRRWSPRWSRWRSRR